MFRSEKRNWKNFAMEFLLIVVEINLGWFVKNFNEQRKETKLERQLLSELKNMFGRRFRRCHF